MSAVARSEASPAPAILVIDDDKAVLISLQLFLEAAGFRVFVASDGLTGIEAFKKHSPAVVVTDIIMPEQEGIATIQQIRRLCPGAKIIAMSGGGRTANADFLVVAQKLGADVTLQKPFSGDELLPLINRLLRGEHVSVAARAEV